MMKSLCSFIWDNGSFASVSYMQETTEIKEVHRQIMDGATVEFEMGPEPGNIWYR